MKFGQVIEYNNINIFFKNRVENEVGRLVPDLFLFFKNVLYEVKPGGLQLNFDIVRQFSAWRTIKTNRIKLRLLIWRYAQFLLLEKGLKVVFLPYFKYDFSRKMFLMLYSINWQNFIVWLPLLLQILVNMCIAILFYQVVTSYNTSNQAVFLHDQNVLDIILNILRIGRAWKKGERKFRCQKLSQTLECAFKFKELVVHFF